MSGLSFRLDVGRWTVFAVQLLDRDAEDGHAGDDDDEDEPAHPEPADLVTGPWSSDTERRWSMEGRQGDPVFQSEDGRHDPGPPYESRRRSRAVRSPGDRERRPPIGFTR